MIRISVKKLCGFKNKAFGLLTSKTAYPVFFETHFGIHTFGLKFMIDVVVVDKHNKVVAVRENMKPNRIMTWFPLYNKVIELPPGFVRDKKIKINDYLAINIIQ